MPQLLLIDDDPALIPKQVRKAFPPPSYRLDVARTGEQGLEKVRSVSPDVVLLDLRLPDLPGLEVYQAIREIDARIPVIFITIARSADAAIEATQRGAYDYLFKPLDLSQLERVVGEALEAGRRMRGPAVMAEIVPFPDVEGAIVGSCAAMREVYKAIGRVAAQNIPVLITGESGTGKELVALAIYQHSTRARAPFLALNCAAIPENLLESELFGHEKGAFSGADRRHIGKFEQYNGGTILLDEIGDMPLTMQAKVLRVLQEQTFERVGGNESIHTDVRLIAATHRDIKSWADDGKFRPDLYYRLGVFMIHLPALRDRGDDLLILIKLFLNRFCLELGRGPIDIAPEAVERLLDHAWPGNIRELQSVLQQAVLKANGNVLLPEFLPSDLLRESRDNAPGAVSSASHGERTLSEIERDAIQRRLMETGGNRQQTATSLGISTRTLLRKIREYNLDDPLRSSPRSTNGDS